VVVAASGVHDRSLAPVLGALAAVHARRGAAAARGIVPGLLVADPRGWTRASDIASGVRLDDLLAAAQRRWNAPPHVAAALAWKCYSYWVALPAVLGWATARRVPLVVPGDVLVRFSDRQPFLQIGLSDPQVATLGDEDELLRTLKASLVDEHLSPVLAEIHGRVRLGHRTLWGSVASGVAYALSRATDVIPGSTLDAANTLLGALGIGDLVELTELPSGELWVQRKTCCLAFLLPEPTICAGCCISKIPPL
jgi:ferric iron reductase protein FhuF